MIPLSVIPWRLIGIGAAVLVIGSVVWRHKYVVNELAEVRVEAAQAKAELIAERENTRKANEADARNQAAQDLLAADRRNDPLPAVRVRKCPVLPQATAPAVVDEAPEANDTRADEGNRDGDLGPELDDFATDAESNLIQCRELMRWVSER